MAVKPNFDIEVEPPATPTAETVEAAPVGLDRFVVLDTDAPEDHTPVPVGTYVGYVEPALVPTGLVRAFEEGPRYLVVNRPWVNVALADGRFVTGNQGDVITLAPDTARRYLDTGAIIAEPTTEAE